MGKAKRADNQETNPSATAEEEAGVASSASAVLSRFQKFTIVRIHRSQLKNAPYNPRRLDPESKRRLKRNLKKVGLIEPVIWNKTTGNLVGGHQRLNILDSLEGSSDYLLDVSQVEMDERTEKEQNIALNNTAMMGTWDIEKLTDLYRKDKLDIDNTGFDTSEIYRMLGEAPLIAQPDKLVEFAEKIRAAQGEMDDLSKEQAEFNDVNYFTVFVWPSLAHRAEVMSALGIPDDRFADGRVLNRLLGIYCDDDAA